jgi:branched-chain amino acid transport system permease protein
MTLESTLTDSVETPPESLRRFARSRQLDLVMAFLVFGSLCLVPVVVSDVYTMNVVILTILFAFAAQSWNILGGYCGQVSLGHGLYFGLGAYATFVLLTKFGVSPWIGIPVGGILSALLAYVISWPFARMKGHYYAIATIVVAEAGLVLITNWEFLGVALGIQLPFGPDSWATLQFGRNKDPYFYVALSLAMSAWLICWFIEDSRAGYWWRAVTSNPEAAQSLGVNVLRSKMAASAMSGALTAVAGGIYGMFVSYIDPSSVMGFQISLLIALPSVLGGVGTLWGPALGALILIPIGEVTRSYAGGTGSGLNLMIYGVLLMGISLLRPEGLISFFKVRRKQAGSTRG